MRSYISAKTVIAAKPVKSEIYQWAGDRSRIQALCGLMKHSIVGHAATYPPLFCN
ncbi:MAG: hypothetical protein AAFR31_00985 [Cyanobacteria bacterium J06627_8]